MGTKLNVYLAVILLFVSYTLSAQRLKIIDSAQRIPLSLATIIEIDPAASSILGKGTTNSSGEYVFEAKNKAKRLVAVTAVGYKKQQFFLNTTDTTILMSPEIKVLNAVSVRARALPLKITGNKIEYDITQVPHADYLTTAEIIDRLPFLQIEENQVKMMNENLTILIDGKSNPVFGTVDGLKSLPPQAVQKVELTLVPTARGNGGKLLNIILKKDYFLGFNGSQDLNASIYGGASRTSLTYWHKKYGFDASLNYSQIKQKTQTNTSILNRADTTALSAQNKTIGNNYSGGVFLSGFYNIDSLSTIDLQLSISPSKVTRSETGASITANQYRSETENNFYDLNNTNFSTAISLNYTKKAKRDGNAFYILTNISHLAPRQQYRFRNISSDQTATGYQDLLNNGHSYEKTLETILQQNAGNVFKYTLGTKFISRNNINNYDIFSSDTSYLTPFKMDQLVSSTYADADFTLKKIVFHTALRLDYNHNHFIQPVEFTQDAFNFVPNLSLSYNMNRSNFFTANYFRSLTRPGSYQYSPVITISNPYERDAGNQHLNNEITNSWGLNYMGNFSFARLGTNFRYADISGLLREVSTVGSDNVVTSTPVNVDAYHSYTLGLFADFQLFKKLRISHNSSGSLLCERFAGRSISQWSGYLTERIYFEINKKSILGFNLTRYSPNLLPQGREQSLAYTKLDFNYSYFFDIGKNIPGSFTIAVTNPNLWDGYRSYTEISSPELLYREDRLRKNSIVSFNFRVSLRGKHYGNRTFNKEKSIQNADLHTTDN